LEKEEKDCRNEGSGVTDADPPDEIYDRESPSNGNVNAPDSDTAIEQVTDCKTEEQEQRERRCEPNEPGFLMGMLQRDVADLIADSLIGLFRGDERRGKAERRDRIRRARDFQLGFRALERFHSDYIVRDGPLSCINVVRTSRSLLPQPAPQGWRVPTFSESVNEANTWTLKAKTPLGVACL